MNTILKAFTYARVSARILLRLYIVLTCLSLIAAHILLILNPGSSSAEALIAPVSRGLQFVDTHWKATLLLATPIIFPLVQRLVPRLTKAYGFEFLPLDEVSKGSIPSERGNE